MVACACVSFVVVASGVTTVPKVGARSGPVAPTTESVRRQHSHPSSASSSLESDSRFPDPSSWHHTGAGAGEAKSKTETKTKAKNAAPSSSSSSSAIVVGVGGVVVGGGSAGKAKPLDDIRPYIVDVPGVSPSFRHQAFSYRCESSYPLRDKLLAVDVNGTQSAYDTLRVTSDEAYTSCYAAQFSSPIPRTLAGQPVSKTDWKLHRGMMVGIFRSPTARVAAGFVNNFESCPAMRREYGERCDPTRRAHTPGDCSAALSPSPSNVRRYFNCVRGCAVNMLNGVDCGGGAAACASASSSLIGAVPAVCENHVPTPEEIAAAVAHVEDGDFAVVGLADQYRESVRRLKAVLSRERVAAVLGGAAAIRTDPEYKAHLERVRNEKARGGDGTQAQTSSPRPILGGPGYSQQVAALSLREELSPLVPHGPGLGDVQRAEAAVAEMLRKYELVDDADAALYAAAVKVFDDATRPPNN